MRVMKWSIIALAVAAGTSQLAMASSQDESKGFVEDSALNVKLRNLYFSRDFRNNDSGQSRREEWGQGFIGTFESGFTQGCWFWCRRHWLAGSETGQRQRPCRHRLVPDGL